MVGKDVLTEKFAGLSFRTPLCRLSAFGKEALWEGEPLVSPIFPRLADLPISRPDDHFGSAKASPSQKAFSEHTHAV